jgi:radical SAM protein with 4Fe4S-binding SPASM domain
MSPVSPAIHRLRLLFHYLQGLTICPGLPPTAVIANTHRCNQFCRMCIREAMTFGGPDMEFGLFQKIIDEGASYFRYLSLDGPGETVMNPEAMRLIGYARSRGIRMMLSTNATLLNREMAEAILDSGLDQIIFSVNGTTPEVYRIVHGVDSYENALTNIRHFLKRKCERSSRTMVILQMVCLPQTLPQVESFYRQWRGIPGVNSVRVKKDVVCVEPNQSEMAPARPQRKYPCPRLWYGPVYIETNGDVYATPGVLYKAEPVGNVRNNTLAVIWNNERMQAMRQAHLQRDESRFRECVDCAYPRPTLPMIFGGFLLDPVTVGRLMPVAEKLAFWHGLPLYEKFGWRTEFSSLLSRRHTPKAK